MSNLAPEVRAAGLFIFRKLNSQIEYLLLQTSRKEATWTPPKGHVDPGESDLETAVRETKEEAGLAAEHFTILDGYKDELKYTAFGRPKTVVYWAAQLKPDAPGITLSNEHVDFRWCPLAEACEVAGFPDMISALKKLDAFLHSQEKH